MYRVHAPSVGLSRAVSHSAASPPLALRRPEINTKPHKGLTIRRSTISAQNNQTSVLGSSFNARSTRLSARDTMHIGQYRSLATDSGSDAEVKATDLLNPRHPSCEYYEYEGNPSDLLAQRFKELGAVRDIHGITALLRLHRDDYIICQERHWIFALEKLVSFGQELEFLDHVVYLLARQPVLWTADSRLVAIVLTGLVRFDLMGCAVAVLTHGLDTSSMARLTQRDLYKSRPYRLTLTTLVGAMAALISPVLPVRPASVPEYQNPPAALSQHQHLLNVALAAQDPYYAAVHERLALMPAPEVDLPTPLVTQGLAELGVNAMDALLQNLGCVLRGDYNTLLATHYHTHAQFAPAAMAEMAAHPIPPQSAQHPPYARHSLHTEYIHYEARHQRVAFVDDVTPRGLLADDSAAFRVLRDVDALPEEMPAGVFHKGYGSMFGLNEAWATPVAVQANIAQHVWPKIATNEHERLVSGPFAGYAEADILKVPPPPPLADAHITDPPVRAHPDDDDARADARARLRFKLTRMLTMHLRVDPMGLCFNPSLSLATDTQDFARAVDRVEQALADMSELVLEKVSTDAPPPPATDARPADGASRAAPLLETLPELAGGEVSGAQLRSLHTFGLDAQEIARLLENLHVLHAYYGPAHPRAPLFQLMPAAMCSATVFTPQLGMFARRVSKWEKLESQSLLSMPRIATRCSYFTLDTLTHSGAHDFMVEALRNFYYMMLSYGTSSWRARDPNFRSYVAALDRDVYSISVATPMIPSLLAPQLPTPLFPTHAPIRPEFQARNSADHTAGPEPMLSADSPLVALMEQVYLPEDQDPIDVPPAPLPLHEATRGRLPEWVVDVHGRPVRSPRLTPWSVRTENPVTEAGVFWRWDPRFLPTNAEGAFSGYVCLNDVLPDVDLHDIGLPDEELHPAEQAFVDTPHAYSRFLPSPRWSREMLTAYYFSGVLTRKSDGTRPYTRHDMMLKNYEACKTVVADGTLPPIADPDADLKKPLTLRLTQSAFAIAVYNKCRAVGLTVRPAFCSEILQAVGRSGDLQRVHSLIKHMGEAGYKVGNTVYSVLIRHLAPDVRMSMARQILAQIQEAQELPTAQLYDLLLQSCYLTSNVDEACMWFHSLLQTNLVVAAAKPATAPQHSAAFVYHEADSVSVTPRPDIDVFDATRAEALFEEHFPLLPLDTRLFSRAREDHIRVTDGIIADLMRTVTARFGVAYSEYSVELARGNIHTSNWLVNTEAFVQARARKADAAPGTSLFTGSLTSAEAHVAALTAAHGKEGRREHAYRLCPSRDFALDIRSDEFLHIRKLFNSPALRCNAGLAADEPLTLLRATQVAVEIYNHYNSVWSTTLFDALVGNAVILGNAPALAYAFAEHKRAQDRSAARKDKFFRMSLPVPLQTLQKAIHGATFMRDWTVTGPLLTVAGKAFPPSLAAEIPAPAKLKTPQMDVAGLVPQWSSPGTVSQLFSSVLLALGMHDRLPVAVALYNAQVEVRETVPLRFQNVLVMMRVSAFLGDVIRLHHYATQGMAIYPDVPNIPYLFYILLDSTLAFARNNPLATVFMRRSVLLSRLARLESQLLRSVRKQVTPEEYQGLKQSLVARRASMGAFLTSLRDRIADEAADHRKFGFVTSTEPSLDDNLYRHAYREHAARSAPWVVRLLRSHSTLRQSLRELMQLVADDNNLSRDGILAPDVDTANSDPADVLEGADSVRATIATVVDAVQGTESAVQVVGVSRQLLLKQRQRKQEREAEIFRALNDQLFDFLPPSYGKDSQSLGQAVFSEYDQEMSNRYGPIEFQGNTYMLRNAEVVQESDPQAANKLKET